MNDGSPGGVGRGPGDTLIEATPGRLVVGRRTYTSGDFVHVLPGGLVGLSGLLFLGIGIARLTLFASWSLPLVVLACLACGRFAATKACNRRTVTVADGTLSWRTGPLPGLAGRGAIVRPDPAAIRAGSSREFTFPWIGPVELWKVTVRGPDGRATLFRRLLEERDAAALADRLRAALREG